MVSIGAPRRRSTSAPAPASPPRACRVRVSVSGLYWNTVVLVTSENGSTPTSAPLSIRGERGEVAMSPPAPVNGASDHRAERRGPGTLGERDRSGGVLREVLRPGQQRLHTMAGHERLELALERVAHRAPIGR